MSQSVAKLLTTSPIDLKLNKISDQDFDQLSGLAENSSFCESNVNNKLLIRIPSEEQCIVIDKSCRIIFELIYNLNNQIKSHIKCDKNSTIIIVTSESSAYKISQSFRLLCLLFDLNIDFKMISVSNVNSDLDFDQYVRDIGQRLLEQNDNSFDGSGITRITISLNIIKLFFTFRWISNNRENIDYIVFDVNNPFVCYHKTGTVFE